MNVLNTQRKKGFFPNSFYKFFLSRWYELQGLFWSILCIGIITLMATYDGSDNSFNTFSTINNTSNLFSNYGALIADIVWQYIGISIYLLPIIFGIWGIFLFNHQNIKYLFKRFIVAITTTCLTIILLPLFKISMLHNYLGIADILMGNYLANINKIYLSIIITALIFCILIGFIYASNLKYNNYQKIVLIAHWIIVKCFLAPLKITYNLCKKIPFLKEKNPTITDSPLLLDESYVQNFDNHNNSQQTLDNHNNSQQIFDNHNNTQQNLEAKNSSNTYEKDKIKTPPKAMPINLSNSHYQFPSVSLLNEGKKQPEHCINNKEIAHNIQRLSKVLIDFGVSGEILKANPGPVVTLYEFEPAAGVKSSRIIGLADDIARSMSAISARIALIPGKNVIGIELPNSHRNTVFLRDLIEDENFTNNSQNLSIALGKTISGENIFTDLSAMPHTIVAGTTGSGKSVAVNAMILSLLYKHSPETCKLILIDPKMLELSIYNDIPHLISPVVTDPKKAIFALKWAVHEMENRYRAMSYLGVRNITSYNNRILAAKESGKPLYKEIHMGFDPQTGDAIRKKESIDLNILPYIVVVVDEMADLMMVAGKDIEIAVQRLAQMARAAGIHVIMATQRPSVDVITGTIKANFPTRISFQVTSKFDSRTILGEQGSEQLLGKGDMLFMEAGSKIKRLHGPFVSDNEVEKVVNFLKNQGKPNYIENITNDDHDEGKSVDTKENSNVEDKDFYNKALEIIKNEQKASTSFIQRRLKIGYNKAASLMEQLEEAGVVSPANATGKRDILIKQ